MPKRPGYLGAKMTEIPVSLSTRSLDRKFEKPRVKLHLNANERRLIVSFGEIVFAKISKAAMDL